MCIITHIQWQKTRKNLLHRLLKSCYANPVGKLVFFKQYRETVRNVLFCAHFCVVQQGKFMNILSLIKRFFVLLFVCTICVFGGAYSALTACTNDQIDVNGDGNTCENVKFTVTTTSAVTTEFKFRMTAKGEFYVD